MENVLNQEKKLKEYENRETAKMKERANSKYGKNIKNTKPIKNHDLEVLANYKEVKQTNSNNSKDKKANRKNSMFMPSDLSDGN